MYAATGGQTQKAQHSYAQLKLSLSSAELPPTLARTIWQRGMSSSLGRHSQLLYEEYLDTMWLSSAG